MNKKPIFRWLQKLTAAFWLIPVCMAHAQTGVSVWTNRYIGGNANAIAVDGNGNVIVTGSSLDASYNNDYATIKYSGAGVPLWTNRYGGGYGRDVAVDGSGNVFVTGLSHGDTFRGDYATIKYSYTGEPLWTNRYDGTGGAAAVAVDASGNVVVTGRSFALGSAYDYATIKYSGAGEPLWTNRYDGLGSEDEAVAVTVDNHGNVFVTGNSVGTNLDADYATIKYSSDGLPLWTNRYGGPENRNDLPRAIAADGNGNVFVTGMVTGVSDAGDNPDYATIKYSNDGVPLWTNRYNGPGNGEDQASALAVDTTGNVFVTGSSVGTNGYADYATIKYSSEGAPLWTNRYNGPGNENDGARGVAVDSNGNVFVTGASVGTGGDSDYATVAYSNAGVPLWISRYDGTGNGTDYAIALAVDRSGNVFATGASIGTSGDYHYATIKYSGVILSPIPLNYQFLGNQFVLSWTNAGFSLQSASLITGTFTNVAGAISPYTNPISGPQQYFRLKAN